MQPLALEDLDLEDGGNQREGNQQNASLVKADSKRERDGRIEIK